MIGVHLKVSAASLARLPLRDAMWGCDATLAESDGNGVARDELSEDKAVAGFNHELLLPFRSCQMISGSSDWLAVTGG